MLGRYVATIGAEHHLHVMTLGSRTYKLDISDTAGRRRYRPVLPVYYRDASIVFVVFDVTSRYSFRRAKSYVSELRSTIHPLTVVVLVGNKMDLANSRTVTRKESFDFATSMTLLYLETSCVTGKNVSEVVIYALKVYHQVVGQYVSSTGQRVQSTVYRSRPTYFVEDLRTGRRTNNYKHNMSTDSLMDADRSGFLTKRGHLFPTWKRRWFVLKDNFLYYFKSPDDANFRGVIHLKECDITVVDQSVREHCFRIDVTNPTTSGHVEYLVAGADHNETQEWIVAIQTSRLKALQLRASTGVVQQKPVSGAALPSVEMLRMQEVTLDVHNGAIVFQSVHDARALPITYAFGRKLRVLRDNVRKREYLITDGGDPELRIIVTDPKGKLMDTLKRLLPSNTHFGTMSAADYFENFNIAYQCACMRLEIPVLKPLLVAARDRFVRKCMIPEEQSIMRELKLASVTIGSADMEALMYALSFYPMCTKLEFPRCELKGSALHILVQECKIECCSIIALDLSFNRLNGADHVPSLVDLLTKNTTVKSLVISNNNIDSYWMIQILNAITSNFTLQYFDISCNPIEDSVSDAFCRMLRHNSTLKMVMARSCGLSGKFSSECINALIDNHTLLELDLNFNELSDRQSQNLGIIFKRNASKIAHRKCQDDRRASPKTLPFASSLSVTASRMEAKPRARVQSLAEPLAVDFTSYSSSPPAYGVKAWPHQNPPLRSRPPTTGAAAAAGPALPSYLSSSASTEVLTVTPTPSLTQPLSVMSQSLPTAPSPLESREQQQQQQQQQQQGRFMSFFGSMFLTLPSLPYTSTLTATPTSTVPSPPTGQSMPRSFSPPRRHSQVRAAPGEETQSLPVSRAPSPPPRSPSPPSSYMINAGGMRPLNMPP